MREVLAIVVVGLGAYLSRAVFILALADRKLPAAWLMPLQFVAPAVLSALVVSVMTDAGGRVVIGLPEIGAFAVAAGTARTTGSHVLALTVGLALYWLIR